MKKTKINKSVIAQAPKKNPVASSLSETKSSCAKQFAFGSLLILLLVFTAYFPALHGEFLWDDRTVFVENPIVTSSNGLEMIWLEKVWLTTDFPLTLTVFWLEHRLWGNDPAGYHAVNFLLHALGAILLWRILLRLKIRGAFLAALIFAVHPVGVASVAWISELKNTLSLFFFLLALLSYLKSEGRANLPVRSESQQRFPASTTRLIFYFLSLAAFFLALLSKTSIVGLPVVLLGIAWWQRGRITARDILRSLPFFLLSLGFGLLTIYAQKVGAIGDEIVQTETFAARLAESAWAIWFYLWKILVPLNLSPIYPHWELKKVSLLAFLPFAALMGIFFLLWQKRKTWGRPSLAAMGFFMAMLFPVLGFSNMYYLIISRVADHWQYVPIIGIVVLLVAGISYLLERKLNVPPKARAGIGATIIFFLCVLTWNHSKVYAYEEKFWSITIEKNPKAWMAYNNLGSIFNKQGKIEQSIRLFKESLLLKTNHAETYNAFGHALAQAGNHEEAIENLQMALKLKPDDDEVHNNFGISLAAIGKVDEAVSHYEMALAKNPNLAEAHNNLGVALMTRGDSAKAIEHFRVACKLKPDYLSAVNGLAWILATHPDSKFRNGTEAVRLASHAVELTNGKDAGVLETLAAAYAESGDFPNALKFAESGIALAKAAMDGEMAARLEAALRLYRANQPYRDADMK